MQPIQNIAVLGVGTMGSAFARRLLGAGMQVTVWDVSHAAAERLATAGARVAVTPEDAVRDARVVLTMVPRSPRSRKRCRECWQRCRPARRGCR